MCVIASTHDRQHEQDVKQQEKEAQEASYKSYVKSIAKNENFDGSWESFQNLQSEHWSGTFGSKYLFNDDKMLKNAWDNYSSQLKTRSGSFGDALLGKGTDAGQGSATNSVYNTNLSTTPLPDELAYTQGTSGLAGGTSTPVEPTKIGGSQGWGAEDPSQIPKPTITTSSNLKAQEDAANKARQLAMDNREKEREANQTKASKIANIKKDTDTGSVGGKKSWGRYGFNQGGFVINTDLEGNIVIKDNQGNDLTKDKKQGQPLPMQEGGEVPVEGMEGMPAPSGQPAGFVEDPMAAPAPDTPMDAMQGEGQQDDVQGELPEGTFVINAMAVQLAGIDELDKMVEKAYEKLSKTMREKGIEEQLINQLVGSSRSQSGMKEDMVDVAVSNGEYIVPPEIVPIIGEDKLRKINDRGLRKLEETKKSKEKQQAPMPMMNKGGFVIATN